ncbi:MAG: hypothetical protein ABWW69_01225 [Pyrodictiaceae archaeon]
MDDRDKVLLVGGLHRLRDGAILSTIGFSLIFFSSISFILMWGVVKPPMAFIHVWTDSMPHPEPGPFPHPGIMVASIIGVLLAVLAGLVLQLVAFFIWLGASRLLRDYDPNRLGLGYTGMMLELAGFIVLIAGMLAAIVMGFQGAPIAGVVLMASLFLGGVLVFIGIIFFGVMLLRLPEVEGVDPGFKAAGILFILSIIPGIGLLLAAVSAILIYMASSRSLARLRGTGY